MDIKKVCKRLMRYWKWLIETTKLMELYSSYSALSLHPNHLGSSAVKEDVNGRNSHTSRQLLHAIHYKAQVELLDTVV